MTFKIFLFKIINRLGSFKSRIRGFYYRVFFKDCGVRFNVRGKMYLYNPQNVYVGRNVTIGPYCRIETVETTDADKKPKLKIGDDMPDI